MARRVVIVGAGPAGIRAAETLVQAGLRPVVIDREVKSGGQIYRRPAEGLDRPAEHLYGSDAPKARALHATFDALGASIDYRPRTEVFGITENLLHVHDGDRLYDLHFDDLILATGATDRIAPIPGWTQPGVYTLGGAQIALKAQGCAIGHRVAFVGSGPLLTLVAAQYAAAGAEVAAVLDTSSFAALRRGLPLMAARPGLLLRGLKLRASLRRHDIPYVAGVRDICIEGDGTRVTGLRWTVKGKTGHLDCDGVGMGWHLRSETQLAQLAGCAFGWDPVGRQSAPDIDDMGRSSRPHVYLAGDSTRVLGADGAETAGCLAAAACLENMERPAPFPVAPLLRRMQLMRRFARGIATAFPYPDDICTDLPDETLLCRCEAITAGDYRATIAKAHAIEPNRAKSLSRVGMGRCQGRYCGAAAARILAANGGLPLEQQPGLRPQAPVRPMPMRLLREDGEGTAG
ncbi:FAD/NAD(P)-dependent oxidoreductase [Roseovarius pacificus]|uniref:FAD-dependent oxidoreductase n=1 Tax=Roseovarius pacificus TaxID=337701 RepID=UPI00403A6090